jgi:hypothetical protein
MDYQKYLKYKTKYLQLKAKLTQLGGAKYRCTNTSKLYASTNSSDIVKDDFFNKGDEVDIHEMHKENLIIFGKVVNGWVVY